jgi:hypothetical protein
MTSASPKFSLVIPTLRRAGTLRHALSTLVSQDYDDFEIIVQNNGHDPETEQVVASFADRKIRCFSTETVLPMTENWETALKNARGQFITFIGDDDGLFPDACKIAARVLDQTSFEVVSWLPFCYYWPQHIIPHLANHLIARVNDDLFVETIDTSYQLQQLYRFALDYSRLPMIYNSFVARSVIDRAIRTNGRYFLGLSPDVTSGIINATHLTHFARLSQPLSMTGISQHSTGARRFVANEPLSSSAIYQRDFTPLAREPRLIEFDHLQVFIARDMLFLHDLCLRSRGIDIDFQGLLELMAMTINERPKLYDDTLAGIRALAKLHHIDMNMISIPARLDHAHPMSCGIFSTGPRTRVFIVDGNEAGLTHIADAVHFAMQHLKRSPLGQLIKVQSPNFDTPLITGGGALLEFRTGANGVPALYSGWAEVENWGTWSVGKRARLMLRTTPDRRTPLHLKFKLRAFVHPLHPETHVVCRLRGKEIAKWSFRLNEPQDTRILKISANNIDASGNIALEFLLLTPCAPSQLGISADIRPLGIGLECVSDDSSPLV